MKNSAEIHTDGINIYVASQVRSHLAGKLIIALFTILVGGLLIFIFLKVDPVKLGAILVPLFLVSFLFYYFIVRYTLWNWFGSEHIIINTKTISYYLNYGWYRTNLKTIPFNHLAFSSEFIQQIGDTRFCQGYFFNYREEDHLPEEIYRTAVNLPQQQMNQLENQISYLFGKSEIEEGFIPFSIN